MYHTGLIFGLDIIKYFLCLAATSLAQWMSSGNKETHKRCEGGRGWSKERREGGRERVEQGIRGVREGEGGARNKRCEGGRGWSKE